MLTRSIRPIDAILVVAVLVTFLAPWLATWSAPLAAGLRYTTALAAVGLLCTGYVNRFATARLAGVVTIAAVLWQFAVAAQSTLDVYTVSRLAGWVAFVPFLFLSYDRQARRSLYVGLMGTGAILLLGVLAQALGLLGGTWGGHQLAGHGALYTSSLVFETRFTSFLLNPNDLALFMALLATLAFMVGSRASDRRVKVFNIIAGSAAVVVVPFTSSRGALLAVPLLLLFLLLVSGSRFLGPALAAAAIFVALLYLAAPTADPLRLVASVESLERLAVGDDASASARLRTWELRSADNPAPLTGQGYAGYLAEVERSAVDDSLATTRTRATVDNGWLKLWLEAGIVGLILVGCSVALLIIDALRVAWRDRRVRLPAVAAASVLAALAMRALSADVLDISPWNLTFWVAAGIALSLSSSPVRSLSVFKMREPGWRPPALPRGPADGDCR